VTAIHGDSYQVLAGAETGGERISATTLEHARELLAAPASPAPPRLKRAARGAVQ